MAAGSLPAISFADRLPPGTMEEGGAVALLLPVATDSFSETARPAATAVGIAEATLTAAWRAMAGAPGPARTLFAPEGCGLTILSGLGAPLDAGGATVEDAAGYAVRAAEAAGVSHLTVVLPDWPGLALDNGRALVRAALGAGLAAHRADPHRDRSRRSDAPPPPERLTLVGPQAAPAAALWPEAAAELAAVTFARDLVNRPSNEKRPDRLAADIEALEEDGVVVTTLEAPVLETLGAGALLAVGRGSSVPPCMVGLEWNGTGVSNVPPVVLVGKGVTFDTGGITIKPPAGMWDMRQDMAGAAAVAGAMRLLARTRAPVRAIGLLPLAENMIGGSAYRPGDIVFALDGTSIEVRDTDAEGRLVLADAIAYARQHLGPQAILVVATLTGSVTAALGRGYAGLFADDAVYGPTMAAAAATRARLWRLPFDKYYRDKLASPIADICQVGPDEERADTCFAAAFLKHFAGDVPLVHIDTSTQHWADESQPTCPVGATGFGTSLLAETTRRLWHAYPERA